MYTISFFFIIYFNFVHGSYIESADKRRHEPGYLLTFPRTLLSNRNETVCLVLHNANVPTKVLVDLKIKDKHYITSHSLEAEHTCFKLHIPEQKFKDPQLASIHLQVQSNATILSAHNDDPIFVYPNKNVIFVESDRGIYKPGDIVRIRALVLTSDLKPPEKYEIPSVKIVNPGGHVVNIWENITTHLGLVQLQYQLADETTLGKWKIETNGLTKQFLVKRYTLPRYKIKLNYPKTIYSKTENVTISLCGSYSYGKPVRGTGLIKISSPNFLPESITKAQEINNGCAEWTIPRYEIPFKNGFTLIITAVITEHGTNQLETTNGKIDITDKPYSLDFSKTAKYFQPGLLYHGKLKIINKLVNTKGEVIEICYNVAIRKPWNIKKNQQCSNFTLNDENAIHFHVLPLKEHAVLLLLQAKSISQITKRSVNNAEIISTTFTVHRWHSPTMNYLHLEQNSDIYSKCKSPQQFTVYYTTKNLLKNDSITFYYMVRSRNEIIKLRKITHEVKLQHLDYLSEFTDIIGKPDKYTKQTTVDKFIIKFKLDPKIVSNTQLLVYYVHNRNNEIIVDSHDIYIEKCLLNKVESQWQDAQLYPGEIGYLKIKTESGSLCAISAVDKANSFLIDSRMLNVNSILQPFIQERVAKSSYIPQCISSSRRPENLESILDLRRRKRSDVGFLNSPSDYDSHDVFNEAGISAITNMKLVNKLCRGSRGRGRDVDVIGSVKHPSMIKTVEYELPDENRGISIRSFFPETWLWELILIGKEGETSFNSYLPHTITSWITNVLCISPTLGVGVSSPGELIVSQPFFVDIISPYSIKRGEILSLQVTTFNYFNYSLPISLILGDTHGIELLHNINKRKVIFCVKPNNSFTHIYRIKGTELGKTNVTVLAEVDSSYPGECGPETIINKRDVVYKKIVIEAEGYPGEITKTTLLCGNDSLTPNNVTWHFSKPEYIVQDSEMFKIHVNADLLGPAIQNLEKLLNVPTGCGEQIMSTLAPNLYVLRYLTNEGNVSPGTTQRAIRNIKIGYQRILDYMHNDGSFSAFGYHDPAGSMFLTAFIVRTLQQAKKYIYVDDTVINKAVKWITEHQLENGCFSAVSHVFQDMGGTSQENSTAALTSYVIISLLESNLQISEYLKTNAKYCIRGNQHPDKYTLALTTYALYLLKWESEANRNLEKLIDLAVHDGNIMWWSIPGSVALNIEMTSYALMSLLHKNTTENLAYASSVVRWLTAQQNSRGGFSSTQDSTVALDALSRYASLVKSKAPNLFVEILATDQQEVLNMQSSDQLKTKEIRLDNVPTDVKIKAKGQGCIIVQASFSYNVNHIKHSEAFKLAIDVDPVSTIDKCSIATISSCVSYTGPGLHSNMAVLEVSMPSGYEPDRASLYQLTEGEQSKVKKFEELENKVALYFTELNMEPVCVPFIINENVIVTNHVEATVTLYDYYKPEMKVYKKYKMNKCEFIDPPMPTVLEGIDINAMKVFENDSIVTSSKELLKNEVTQGKLITKRNADEKYPNNYSNLNKDFVDMDVEMDVPDCVDSSIMLPGPAEKNTMKVYNHTKT